MRKIGNLYFHGNRDKKEISLTFDDGPSNETDKILEVLKRYNARATFFVLGQRIKGREKILKRTLKEGNEIGNHSYEHKRLEFRTKDYIKKEINKCDEELKKIGVVTGLFRPPQFSKGFNLYSVCRELEKKIIFCDVVSMDWKKLGVEKVVKRVLRKTKDGSIIDFHDYLWGIGCNRKIIPIIKKLIPELQEMGYKIVTVSELLINFS